MTFNLNINRFQKSLVKLFKEPNPSLAVLRELAAAEKARHEANPSTDSFFVEVSLGPPIRIPWSCNTKTLLGCRQLTYESFMDRVHPGYKGIFLYFGLAAYQLMFKYKDVIWQQPAAYGIMVPLRHDDGRYFWFNHFSEPSGLTEDRCLTHHLNAYRLVSEFQGNMLLSRPYVLFRSDAVPDAQQQLQQIAAKAILGQMFELKLERRDSLDPVHQRILLAWWKVYAEQGPEGTNHRTVAEQLPFSASTLRRYVQPILEAARLVFPLYPIRDMNDLGRLLVGLFGAEGCQFPQQGSAPY
jgi:hypothetical protein